MSSEPTIEVRNLKKYFDRETVVDKLLRRNPSPIQAVDDVSFALGEGESVGVIGESGCGKTTLIRTLIGLYEPTGGEILYDAEPVSGYDGSDWQEFRRNVQIIFQDPFNSLDPKMTVRDSLYEPLKIHGVGDRRRRAVEILDDVELNPPEQYLDQYPKHLSGGEKQRVSIARALILEPDVVLADEPVSMLDVSTQAKVLSMLSELMEERDTSLIYISHDLSTVSYVCDEINVMYLGRIVEQGPTAEILQQPKHPYTQALINAIPIPDPNHERERTDMEGAPREPVDLDTGCRFRDRCPERMDVCEISPNMVSVGDDEPGDHRAACHLYYDHEVSAEEAPIGQSSSEGDS